MHHPSHRPLPRTAVATAVALALTIMMAGATLAATVITDAYRISLDGLVVAGCDEDVLLSGEIQITEHVTDRGDDGISGLSVSAATGLSGVGLTSGDTYRAVGATVNVGSQDAPLGSYSARLSITLVDRTYLIGTGGATSLKIGTTFHITKLDGENAVLFEHGPYGTCG